MRTNSSASTSNPNNLKKMIRNKKKTKLYKIVQSYLVWECSSFKANEWNGPWGEIIWGLKHKRDYL